MRFDIQEVAALLNIVKDASEHQDKLSHIRDAALNELRKINADHAPQPQPEPELSTLEGPSEKPEESIFPLREKLKETSDNG